MELDRDELLKAWECCASPQNKCEECPIDKQKKDDCICGQFLAQTSLKYFKSQEQKIFELENRLKECENGYEGTLALERAKVKELTEENEKLNKRLALRERDHNDTLDLLYKEEAENKRLRERNITLEQKLIILGREEIPVLKVQAKGE